MEHESELVGWRVPISRPDGRSDPFRFQNEPPVYARSDRREREARLSEVIAAEIVPRLLMIHHDVRRVGQLDAPLPEEIAQFGKMAMAPEAAIATAYFEKMRELGHSLDSLFVNLLAPTARHLGELWEQDRCDFIDVTLGVARLQELLAIFGSTEEVAIVDLSHNAVLVATYAEKHMFGVEMVAKFMRGAGWSVAIEKSHTPEENAEAVAAEWVGVIGITASAASHLDAVALTIETMRRASRNPKVKVMVGGPAFHDKPELVARVGADVAAPDAPSAVILAKRLLMMQAKG